MTRRKDGFWSWRKKFRLFGSKSKYFKKRWKYAKFFAKQYDIPTRKAFRYTDFRILMRVKYKIIDTCGIIGNVSGVQEIYVDSLKQLYTYLKVGQWKDVYPYMIIDSQTFAECLEISEFQVLGYRIIPYLKAKAFEE